MMKRITSLKRTATAIAALLLLFAFAATAHAADASATYYGTYAGSLFGFAPDDGTGSGLFPDLQNMMPGGTYTQKIKVSNPSGQRVELFLRGEAVSESVAGLLNKITFEVKNESGTVLVPESSVSSPWPSNGLQTNAGTFLHLGRFYPGDAQTLTVTLKVPASLDNTYQNAVGKVKWVFQADVYVPDDDDDDDRPRRTPTIPLGPGPIITIDENQIPLSPGTGDDTNLLLWGGLFVVFTTVLVVLLLHKRRSRV